MKKLALIVSLAAMLAIPVTGCGGEPATYTDSGQTITVNVGQEFVIALGANATTGYSWQENYDSTMLKLVEKKYVAEETEGKLVGTGGVEYFRFRALATGSTEITLDYQRSWEEASEQTKVFSIYIK